MYGIICWHDWGVGSVAAKKKHRQNKPQRYKPDDESTLFALDE